MALVRSPVGISKPPTYRLIGLQLLVTVVSAAAGWLTFGPVVARSALLGGLIVVLPSAYFAWRAFAYNQTRSAARVLGGFYQAELGKLLLTALLFAGVFKLVEPLHHKSLFIAFGVVLFSGLAGSVSVLGQSRKTH